MRVARRVAADPQSVPARRELGQVLVNLAQIEQGQGQPEGAIQGLQRAIAIESQLAADDPRSLDVRITLAGALASLAQVQVGQPDGSGPAMASLQQAVAILEPVTNEHPELAVELEAEPGVQIPLRLEPLAQSVVAEALRKNATYNHVKGKQWWRTCDNKSFQDMWILKGRAPGKTKGDWGLLDIVARVPASEDMDRTCAEKGHTA